VRGFSTVGGPSIAFVFSPAVRDIRPIVSGCQCIVDALKCHGMAWIYPMTSDGEKAYATQDGWYPRATGMEQETPSFGD
jgi:hypothetical protein